MTDPGDMDIETVEIGNWQGVGCNGRGEITVAMPKTVMARGEALAHAAWIVALADEIHPDRGMFPHMLRRVLHT